MIELQNEFLRTLTCTNILFFRFLHHILSKFFWFNRFKSFLRGGDFAICVLLLPSTGLAPLGGFRNEEHPVQESQM